MAVPPFARRQGTVREDAVRLLELARMHPGEVDPILPFVYQRAGDAFARLGEPEQARQQWQAALAEVPEGSPVFEEIAAQIAALGPGPGPAGPRAAGNRTAAPGLAQASVPR